MPRKIQNISEEVMRRVKENHPSVPWIAIDDLPEDQVAATLRANKIFFSAQDQEGFGLPALEAMVCGCLVAGFGGTGHFPHPYVSKTNGFWAKDLDINGAVKAVGKAIRLAQEGGPSYEQMIRRGQATATRFDRESSLAALHQMVDVVAQQRYKDRSVRPPDMGPMGWIQLVRYLRG